MERIIKLILFFLLAVVLHVSVNDNLVREDLSEEILSLSYSSQQYSVDSIRLPYLPDGELGGVGLYLQQPVSSRTHRIYFEGFAYSLRDIVQVMADRDAMLFGHWQKLSNRALLSSITHPVSEYYVFALKHIII